MKLNRLLLCAVPLIAASCSSYAVARNGPCLPMERDEIRRFDEPSLVSDDPSSPLHDIALQKGRVGLIAARY
jgi:hypothetical protein